MSIADKLMEIADKIPQVYNSGFQKGMKEAEGAGDTTEAYNQGVKDGKQAEYDVFWDGFQQNGTEYLNYGYAFANKDIWTQENIEKVKYKVLRANYFSVVFSGNTSIADLSAFSFETGKGTYEEYRRMTLSATFNGCTNLKKCMHINCDMVYDFTNAFNNCTSLEELPLTGVIIRGGLNLQWSTKLNKESITSVINCLSSGTSGLTVTLSLTAVNNAFEGGRDGTEWQTLIATKPNWTIAYA